MAGKTRTKPKKVLFSGSRNWIRPERVGLELKLLIPEVDIIIHGGAKGLDMMVDVIARQLGFRDENIHVYLPDWDKLGNKAGVLRNQAMVDVEKPDVVIGFCLNGSKGTSHCIGYARGKGIPTIVYYLD